MDKQLSLQQRQFLYVAGEMSEREVSRQTGIPRSTLYDFKQGRYGLNPEQAASLRNLFQRTAYTNLRYSGMPREVARRYSWQTPETVTNITTSLDMAVAELATGSLEMATEAAEMRGSILDRETKWVSIVDSIRGGLRNAKIASDEWETYLSGLTAKLKST